MEDREEFRAAMSGVGRLLGRENFLVRLSKKKNPENFFRNQEKIVALKNRCAYYAFQ
jgi:hypothetical protein